MTKSQNEQSADLAEAPPDPADLPSEHDKTALSLRTYRAATRLMGPVAELTLKRRLKQGKEHPERIGERRGIPGKPRPEGALIWIHGASVGESLSVLPLVDRLLADHPDATLLVTTGTVTSASLMASRLPERAIHQFAPLDHPGYVTSFLNHWQPNACIFVESELWPTLIQETSDRKIPMALVNGRISPKSYKNWKQRPTAIKSLLDSFTVILGQDQNNANRFADLSKRTVPMLGNLKMAASPLPGNETLENALAKLIGKRPVWLAASTHSGEEEEVLAAHIAIKEKFPDVLTIIAPRHPPRGDAVENLIWSENLIVARRSTGEEITPDTDIYLADTLGELGVFYRLCDIAFIGGSLVETGGHNPLEPARLGAAILYGPNIFNFGETYAAMRKSGGTALVRNGQDLTAALNRLLTDELTRNEMSTKAKVWSAASADEVLNNIVDALAPVLKGITAQTTKNIGL